MVSENFSHFFSYVLVNFKEFSTFKSTIHGPYHWIPHLESFLMIFGPSSSKIGLTHNCWSNILMGMEKVHHYFQCN